MIYFVQSVSGGPVKIGCVYGSQSVTLKNRMRALETMYGHELVALGTMEGDCAREAEIHAQFAHLRLGSTEQFQPAPELMAFIGLPVLGNPSHGTVKPLPVVKRHGISSTPIRLTDRDKSDLESIRKHFKLDSRAAAVRAAIKTAKDQLGINP